MDFRLGPGAQALDVLAVLDDGHYRGADSEAQLKRVVRIEPPHGEGKRKGGGERPYGDGGAGEEEDEKDDAHGQPDRRSGPEERATARRDSLSALKLQEYRKVVAEDSEQRP